MRKKSFKALITAIAMSVMVLGSTMTVFAAPSGTGTNSDIASYVSSNGDNMKSSVLSSFQTFTDVNDMNAACDNTYVYYTYQNAAGNTVYCAIKSSDEASVASRISNINNSSQMTSNLNTDVLGGFSTGADTTTATGLLVGFQKPISTLLGIIVIVVTMGMTVFTSLDLAYIAFPVFREKCDTKKQTGGPGTKPGKDGTTKLSFITDDAQHAVIAADTVQSGKSPFVIYLKTRMLSFILLAIVIFILLTGNISIFATLALKLVQGILDFLDGFK